MNHGAALDGRGQEQLSRALSEQLFTVSWSKYFQRPADFSRETLGHSERVHHSSCTNTMKNCKFAVLFLSWCLTLSACANTQPQWNDDGSVVRGTRTLKTELQNVYTALPALTAMESEAKAVSPR